MKKFSIFAMMLLSLCSFAFLAGCNKETKEPELTEEEIQQAVNE
jgi:hypothetical protein